MASTKCRSASPLTFASEPRPSEEDRGSNNAVKLTVTPDYETVTWVPFVS
jgi:hypothetical protein